MPAKMSFESFLNKTEELFGGKYSYEKYSYTNTSTAMMFTDNSTGVIYNQRPDKHLLGQKPSPLKTISNIQKLINIKLQHSNFIIVSDVLGNKSSKLTLNCIKHGVFHQSLTDLLLGRGCGLCGRERTVEGIVSKAKKTFVSKSKKTHCLNDGTPLYDYSLSEYIDTYTPVDVICKVHGIFKVPPVRHNGNDRQGCPKCSKISYSRKRGTNKNDFVELSKEKYGNKFDYSNVQSFVNESSTVSLKCLYHNEQFDQVVSTHLAKKTIHGCPLCAKETAKSIRTDTRDDFIRKARILHNNEFGYDNVIYKGTYKKILITCFEHGDFSMTPNSHMNGRGCPTCKTTEAKCIQRDIDPHFIKLEKEKKFDDCVSVRRLPFDRYVSHLNMLLEYDGEMHFIFKKRFHKTEDNFEKVRNHDKIKTEYAINNGYNFIRIAYYEDHVAVLESFLKLIEENPGKQIVQIYGDVKII